MISLVSRCELIITDGSVQACHCPYDCTRGSENSKMVVMVTSKVSISRGTNPWRWSRGFSFNAQPFKPLKHPHFCYHPPDLGHSTWIKIWTNRQEVGLRPTWTMHSGVRSLNLTLSRWSRGLVLRPSLNDEGSTSTSTVGPSLPLKMLLVWFGLVWCSYRGS